MDKAENLEPAEAAAEAVKAYLRLHRRKISDDPELLALLLPERFSGEPKLVDYQNFVIGKLSAKISELRAECDGLRPSSHQGSRTRESVKRLVLELAAANSFEEAIKVACCAGGPLGAEFVSVGIEINIAVNPGELGVRLLPCGTVEKLIERDALGALLIGDAYKAFCPDAESLQSVAVFRMRLGPKAPPAIFAVGSHDPFRFDDSGETREIAFFVRTLETTIRRWLNPPAN